MLFLTELAVKLITANYNISKEEAKRKYLETTGIDFAGQLNLIFPDYPKSKEVVETFEARKLKGILDKPIFPDTVPTLKSFREKRIKTFICSSTKQEIITRYCHMNKIDDLVDGAFGYRHDLKKDKQIDFILQHDKLQPNEVLFVGDSLKDYDYIKDIKVNFVRISRIFSKAEFQKRRLLSVNNLTTLVKLFDKSEEAFKSIEEVKLCGDG
jgi:phosphoglycolate phosphatase-like HAD superfamily hydrolase